MLVHITYYYTQIKPEEIQHTHMSAYDFYGVIEQVTLVGFQ